MFTHILRGVYLIWTPAADMMKLFLLFFSGAHALVAVLFLGIAVMLGVIAVETAISAVGQNVEEAANRAIEATGLLAVAVVVLQIAQTISEEEVIRDATVSAPTRARRYLSRFLVVTVVALSIEGLVAVFKVIHTDPQYLPHAAAIVVATGALLGGWGLFIHFNRRAEDVEPEAMEQAKAEDRKLTTPGQE